MNTTYDVDEALDRLRFLGIDLAKEAENPRVAYSDIVSEIEEGLDTAGFTYDQFVLALHQLVELGS